MIAPALTPAAPLRLFPDAPVRDLLRKELQAAADDSSVLHPGWEPVLDSLAIVTVVTALEGLLEVKLPPEKLIRRGGYRSVDEAVEDMTTRTRDVWTKLRKQGPGR